MQTLPGKEGAVRWDRSNWIAQCVEWLRDDAYGFPWPDIPVRYKGLILALSWTEFVYQGA